MDSSASKIMVDKGRHLICVPYSIAGLHATAAQLGIERFWYHPGRFPHYDIPRYRFEELKRLYGVVSPKELLKVIKQFVEARDKPIKQEVTHVGS